MTTLRSVIAAAMAVAAAFPSAPSAQGALDLDATPEGREAIAVWRAESHQFTPAVRQAFVAAARARTQAQLAGAGKPLPPDFLAWVDSDPVVQATVYGARSNAANVLLMLRSLELDLGGDVVRRDYAQLALAMAVVHAAEGPQASLSNRTRLQIVIPGDPRKPVDTTDAARPLQKSPAVHQHHPKLELGPGVNPLF